MLPVLSWGETEVLSLKLSIVIPVYNTRDYLSACLDSVLEPGCDDYEIVVVNDGSTDDSGIIAAGCASRFPALIRVITTENGGLGAARNVGLEAARGDYLLFLDSDDTLAAGALKEILAGLDGSFDIGIFDILQVNPSGDTVGTIIGCGEGGDFTLSDHPALLFEPPSACNKLFRRSLFLESGVRFPGRVWFEDLRTVPKLYPLAGHIRNLAKPWYRYLTRSGAITTSATGKRKPAIIDAASEIIGYYKDAGLYEHYQDELCYMAFYNVFLTSSVRVNAADPKSEVQEQLMQWFLRNFPDWRGNPYVKGLSAKHRLLTELLMKRKRQSVHMIMKLNDKAKNKNG